MASKITNEILTKLQKNNKEQVYEITSGNATGIKKVIKELQVMNIHSEETFFGNKPYLYVHPSGTPIENLPKPTRKKKKEKVIDDSLFLDTPFSSNIHKVKWAKGNLYVIYKTNLKKEYEYPNVPKEEMLHIIQLEKDGASVGSYIARQIKPKYSINR